MTTDEYIGDINQEQQVPAQAVQAPAYVDPYYQGVQPANLFNQKEYLDVIKHYTDDETIPEEVKKSKWAIFGRGLSLTFLDEKDLPIIDMFNQVLRIDALTNQPPHKMTFEETHQLDQTQLFFYLQAKRAIGTGRGKMNERTLQVTQIGQSISTSTQQVQQQPRSILSKVRGLF